MKGILFPLLLSGAACFSGCIQQSKTEQRVVELPENDPGASLETAAKIGQALIASGLLADIQKQFPSISPQRLKGAYLTWNTGAFGGKKSVFFITGIQYTGTLPEAKAIADYCESRIKEAVDANFSAVSP